MPSRSAGLLVIIDAKRGDVGTTNDAYAQAFLGVDALDPAFAPGTGTPEPGGMTSTDLLWACREVAERTALVGADVVEVLPTQIGAADITAAEAEPASAMAPAIAASLEVFLIIGSPSERL